jgi:hypothetical protein
MSNRRKNNMLLKKITAWESVESQHRHHSVVTQSPPETLHGVITEIQFDKKLVWIRANNGTHFKASTNNFYNSSGKHGCIVQPGDEVRFNVLRDNGGVKEVFFVNVPDVQMAGEEVSQVTAIQGGIIWGERLIPDCGCSIVIGSVEDFPRT